MTPYAMRVTLELRAKNHDSFAKQLGFKWKFELSTIFKLSSLRIRSIKCLCIRALALCYVGEQINAVLVYAERLSAICRFLWGSVIVICPAAANCETNNPNITISALLTEFLLCMLFRLSRLI